MSRFLVPVLFLLVVGLVGMLNRGSVREVTVVGAEYQTDHALAATPSMTAPVLDSWASSATGAVAVDEVEVRGGGVVAAVPTSAQAWPLSIEDAESVLLTAGWPEEWISEGLSVACGPAWNKHREIPAINGESGCDPSTVGDGGNSIGLFQIQPRWWADRCGLEGPELHYPLVNARCALIIMRYSESVGLDRWHYWSAVPLGAE